MSSLIYTAAESIIPVRSEARHASEQITQLLYGEPVKILETVDRGWSLIQGLLDGYQGYVVTEMLKQSPKQSDSFEDWNQHWLNWNSDFPIHYGKRMPLGALCKQGMPSEFDNRIQLSKAFLDTPYLWGGRHIMGIDCSGFTQLIFRHSDIWLPRDAWQQEEKGEVVDSIQEAEQGDLIFCTNEKGRVTHVGILIEPYKVIHASVRVRIDHVDEKGIRREDGTYSHNLHSIRRYEPGKYFDL